ncbi:response regulator [Candidatus Woesearchaeota archaeon]|nr:response regulator [Candidatus Woesearchaeota archaeon]
MKNVLIVDDEPQIVELVKLSLGDNYKYLTAFNGEEALEKLKKSRPDLILLDIMMPKVNGYQVLTKLKADPNLKKIPIIFLTAKGEWNDKMKALALGASSDYITKPFDPDDLKQRVRNVF